MHVQGSDGEWYEVRQLPGVLYGLLPDSLLNDFEEVEFRAPFGWPDEREDIMYSWTFAPDIPFEEWSEVEAYGVLILLNLYEGATEQRLREVVERYMSLLPDHFRAVMVAHSVNLGKELAVIGCQARVGEDLWRPDSSLFHRVVLTLPQTLPMEVEDDLEPSEEMTHNLAENFYSRWVLTFSAYEMVRDLLSEEQGGWDPSLYRMVRPMENLLKWHKYYRELACSGEEAFGTMEEQAERLRLLEYLREQLLTMFEKSRSRGMTH